MKKLYYFILLMSIFWLCACFNKNYLEKIFIHFIDYDLPEDWPVYKVIIDPGHGGAGIRSKDNKHVLKSDRWDPVTKNFLSHYPTGMEADGYKESHVMLELAMKVHAYLKLTETKKGWGEFEKLLRKFSPQKNFEPKVIQSVLTRHDNYEDRFDKIDNLYVNNDYRMLDYPDDRGRLQRGRISFINYQRPSLVLSLHGTPAGEKNEGGMAAVLAAGFKSYDEVVKIQKKYKSFSKGLSIWKKSLWNGKILTSEAHWNQFQSMHADAWTYFHGYRSNEKGTGPDLEKPRGLRQNLISWIYKDDNYIQNSKNQEGPYSMNYNSFFPKGKFWSREKAQEEFWRREDGILGYGGDNHYASDEMMRYVQYGVRLLKPKMREEGKIGPINTPFVSSYLLPIYVNAIVAFLEIACLDKKRDRRLIIEEGDAVAQSLAVGVYSLYTGLKLRPLPKEKNPFPPKSQPLNFKKYKDYFEKVTN